MILVIGFGNTLRRDDGAGVALARLVSRSLPEGAGSCREVPLLVPELAEEIAQPAVAGVIFCDVRPPGNDGEESVRVTRLAAAPPHAPLGHLLAPESLLAIAATLYGFVAPAWLVTVAGRDFGHGEGLSEPVRHALGQAEGVLADVLQECLKAPRAAASSTGSLPA